MTSGKPSPPIDPSPNSSTTSLGWTGREREIIFRTLAAPPHPADNAGAAPSALAPSSARSIRLSPPRRQLDRGQIAVLAGFVLALLAFLVGSLTYTERSTTSAPQVAARPPVEENQVVTAASVSSATQTRAELETPPTVTSAYSGDEVVVRAFYEALGNGDGEVASALVVAEKRSSEAFSPRAISRFYGGLREPLRLMEITPLDDRAFRVSYRYSAGRSRCDGEAVVSLASRNGRDLIRSIRALNGC